MEFVVYGTLRSATGTKRVDVAFGGDTVADALASFVEAYPRTAGQLYADDGSLRPSVRVMRDGDRVDPGERCSDSDVLALFPAMQGG